MSDWTHKYVGRPTKWGLNTGAKIKIVGKRAGGKLVRADGQRQVFLVNKNDLEPLKSTR